MKYISTRGYPGKFSSAEVIKAGIAPDGGLFVPESIPLLTRDDIMQLKDLPYPLVATEVLSRYLTDFKYAELREYCEIAYSEENFGEPPIPVVQLNKYNSREFILELWHGPTSAFKDVALQLLPYLMTSAVRMTGEDRKIMVLTATSGDTGKAALEGFKDVPGTEVLVFYPSEGVSEAQRLQMATTDGDNTHVIAVRGCFDDTQTGVKKIFADEELRAELDSRGVMLSSANSINWGRLVPQIAYYVYAYVSLLSSEKLEEGEKINVVVPTGNFGNILAAWYAKKMGIPIHKLVCASNRNKVLSDFFRTGTYDRQREFYKTNSPSMDILISSNLERLLFEISEKDSDRVNQWMKSLSEEGKYAVDPVTLRALQTAFVGGFADEAGITKSIRDTYDRCDHVIDTHTAVGFNVYGRYYQRSGDQTKTVFVSTASPYKFVEAVMDSLLGNGYSKGRSQEVLIQELGDESGLVVPPALDGLADRPIRHDIVIDKQEMIDEVRKRIP
ncbi:MAG: threonine synthase [Oscillospiraceae bacterium]|nr:threonine synthase [Clostridiales bacterium]MDD4095579.1 threonine synthase [Oscillospiraceae bacterium]